MKGITRFVGLDLSKETIAVAVAEEGREGARYWGTVSNAVKIPRSSKMKFPSP